MPTTEPSRSDSKREAILAAARDRFARHGFAATRIEDIARRAGVGKGTVYEYFRSKELLLVETAFSVCDSHKLDFETQLAAVTDEVPGSAADILQIILERSIGSVLAHTANHLRIFSDLMALAYSDPDLFAHTRERICLQYEDWEQALLALYQAGSADGSLRRLEHPAMLTQMIVSMVDGWLWRMQFRHDLDPAHVAADCAATLIELLRPTP